MTYKSCSGVIAKFEVGIIQSIPQQKVLTADTIDPHLNRSDDFELTRNMLQRLSSEWPTVPPSCYPFTCLPATTGAAAFDVRSSASVSTVASVDTPNKCCSRQRMLAMQVLWVGDSAEVHWLLTWLLHLLHFLLDWLLQKKEERLTYSRQGL